MYGHTLQNNNHRVLMHRKFMLLFIMLPRHNSYYVMGFFLCPQLRPGREMHCYSSAFIQMHPLIHIACMEAAPLLRVRSGLRQNGFMLGHSISQ